MRSFLLTPALLASVAQAYYALIDDYNPTNFFDKFDTFTGDDPTQGFVKFVQSSSPLYSSTSTSVKMAVDSTNQTPGGRPGIRLTSAATYTEVLIIADIAHMPGGQCGVWPAFWTFGANWPDMGEIDIVEGVNSDITNSMTLHTGGNCNIDNSGFSGNLVTSQCYVNAPGQFSNQGCQIHDESTQSYGPGFNAAGGGVFAVDWTSSAIRMWFFPRGSIPSDVTSGTPNPNSWGMPKAAFSGGCDIKSEFIDHNIIFDTTFCGTWAGTVWGNDPVCASKAPTCNEYVANNPQAFAEAYWEVNGIKVYQDNGQSGSAPVVQSAPAVVEPSSTPAVIPAPPAESTTTAPPAVIPSNTPVVDVKNAIVDSPSAVSSSSVSASASSSSSSSSTSLSLPIPLNVVHQAVVSPSSTITIDAPMATSSSDSISSTVSADSTSSLISLLSSSSSSTSPSATAPALRYSHNRPKPAGQLKVADGIRYRAQVPAIPAS